MKARLKSTESSPSSAFQVALGAQAFRPMILILDGIKPVLRVNTQFSENFGHDASDIEARPLMDWIHSEDREDLERAIFMGGDASARMKTADGEWIQVDWNVRRDHKDNTAILGLEAVPTPAASSRLESVAKKYESKLLETLDALARVVEANYQGLRCSILLVDENQDFVTGSAGPSLSAEYKEAVKGLRIGPVVGSCGAATFWNFPVIVENVATDPLWRDLQDMAKLSGIHACWSFPVTATTGEVVGALALYSDQPSAPTEGQMHGLEITARMIALAIERDALEVELLDVAKREREDLTMSLHMAEDANRMKSDFLANVSHELRTPMNGVIGMTDLALGTKLTEEQREYLEMAQSCSIELLDLLNDLLDVSKIEAGMLELESVDFDAVACVEDAVGLMASRASDKGIELICNIPNDFSEWLCGDPTRLKQVIVNLCSNAVKFTTQGEVEVKVKTRARSDGKTTFECSVRDTGIGIPKNRQKDIFKSFIQADGSTTRQYGGSGLGLTISTQLAEIMDGSLEVESEAGEGSTFRFSVVMEEVDIPPAIETHSEFVDCRVLIADDNTTNRHVLHELLSSWGCQVESVSSGPEALAQIKAANSKSRPFRLLLLDTMMPDVSGFAVERTLHEESSQDVPAIIMLNTLGSERPVRPEGSPTWDAMLNKPVRRSALFNAAFEALAPVKN
ncbi:MAG: signal transduction histidine kinase [Planctomycetota bacterium]|jgi:signal transduction histidine kinase